MRASMQMFSKKFSNVLKWLKLDTLKTRSIWIYALNVFDLIATTVWVMWFGVDVEANPFAKWMYQNNSIYVVKALVVAAGLYLLNKLIPKHPKYECLTWVLFVVYAAIAIYHLFLTTQLILIFSRV
jgi:hypothetical protein